MMLNDDVSWGGADNTGNHDSAKRNPHGRYKVRRTDSLIMQTVGYWKADAARTCQEIRNHGRNRRILLHDSDFRGKFRIVQHLGTQNVPKRPEACVHSKKTHPRPSNVCFVIKQNIRNIRIPWDIGGLTIFAIRFHERHSNGQRFSELRSSRKVLQCLQLSACLYPSLQYIYILQAHLAAYITNIIRDILF